MSKVLFEGSGEHNVEPKARDLDKAFDFLNSHGRQVDPSINLRALRRKVDWHVVTFLFVAFLMQFLDKVVYNYAAVMGMPQDLMFKGNDYSDAATIFYGAYIAAEVLNVIALQRLPAAKWLGANMIIWGIACGAAAGAHNYTTMLVARLFLGIVEAAIGPCLTAISSQWYRKDEQSIRFSVWYTSLGIGQIVGGLISYGFQNLQPGHALLASWRIMFLVVGALTLVAGLATFLFLPSTPMQARWLSDAEKIRLLEHISVNRTGVENFRFHARHILEALADPQVWLLGLMTISTAISAAIGTTYSTTLIKLFGISSPEAALLNMPIGIVVIVATLFAGLTIRYHILPRSVAFCIVTAVGLLGACLLAFVPSPTPLNPNQHRQNLPALLAGVYLVNAAAPTLALLYSWTAANISGSTKKAVVYCLISACFGVGNIIGLQSFQARDVSSGYRPAKIAVVGTLAAAIVLTLILWLYYYWQNSSRRRDTTSEQKSVSSDEGAWQGMSDKEDRLFRYAY